MTGLFTYLLSRSECSNSAFYLKSKCCSPSFCNYLQIPQLFQNLYICAQMNAIIVMKRIKFTISSKSNLKKEKETKHKYIDNYLNFHF